MEETVSHAGLQHMGPRQAGQLALHAAQPRDVLLCDDGLVWEQREGVGSEPVHRCRPQRAAGGRQPQPAKRRQTASAVGSGARQAAGQPATDGLPDAAAHLSARFCSLVAMQAATSSGRSLKRAGRAIWYPRRFEVIRPACRQSSSLHRCHFERHRPPARASTWRHHRRIMRAGHCQASSPDFRWPLRHTGTWPARPGTFLCFHI